VKINFKKGWNRILIILSVVWGVVCFIFVLEHERGLGSILFFSALIWVVGLVVFLLLVYIAACFIAPQTIGARYVYHSIPLVISMGGIVLTAVLAQATKLGKILSSKPLLWLGEVSFSIYLLHRPVMGLISKLIPSDAHLHWSLKLAVMLMLVGIVSQLAYLLVEKPGRAFIRSKSFGIQHAISSFKKST